MIFVLIRIVWEWLRRAGLPIPPLPRLGSRTSVLERLLLRPENTPGPGDSTADRPVRARVRHRYRRR